MGGHIMERKARINFNSRRKAPPGAQANASRAFVFSDDLADLHRLIAMVGELELPLAFAGSLDGFNATAAARRRTTLSAGSAIVLLCVELTDLDDPDFADGLACLPSPSRLVLLSRGNCMQNGLDRLPLGTVALLPVSSSS